jgi:class 3 adenylate cyclase
LIDSAVLGLLLSLLTVALQWANFLEAAESWLYDKRALYCQFFSPLPTDRLVHLDIDDGTLDAIGSWPWPRKVLGDLVAEIDRAGAKAIALDIILSEPQKQEYVPQRDGTVRPVDNDEELAGAIRQSGKVLVPLRFTFNSAQRTNKVDAAMVQALIKDLELAPDELERRIPGLGGSRAGVDADAANRFIRARQEAMRSRLKIELDRAEQTPAELYQRLLPKASLEMAIRSPLTTLLDKELQYLLSVRESSRRFAIQPTPNDPFLVEAEPSPPLISLVRATASSGFVDYLPDYSDGKVRSVPLLLQSRGRVYPQLALSLACMMYGSDSKDIRLEGDAVVIPRPHDTGIRLPVRTEYSSALKQSAGALFYVPWFGPKDWQSMYGRSRQSGNQKSFSDLRQHVSLVSVWNIVEIRRRIETNTAGRNKALLACLEFLDQTKQQALAKKPPSDPAWSEATEETLSDLKAYIEQYDASPTLTDEDRRLRGRMILARKAIAEGNSNITTLRQRLGIEERLLATQVRGRAVLVGWIATGTITDFISTSLHPQCPGVVAHGVILNAILTGEFWRPISPPINYLITFIAGVLTAVLAVWLTPVRSFIATILLGIVYLLLNGIVLFDYGNLIVGLAGPLFSIFLVWTGCVLIHVFLERGERLRITRRFGSYVDPVLVNYVVEHPEQIRLDGQVKELTVGFSDLDQFTPLSELLGEKVVPLLSDFMSLVVPVIRNRGGYVNKFLGDGIMYFFGAPVESPRHAFNAVATAIEIHKALQVFNDRLKSAGLPAVSLKTGLGTGVVVVGDMGPSDASDYTVLGDTVNFSSRLEGANKALGTSILVSARTIELIGDDFLVRPVGTIRVVGKRVGMTAYEVLNWQTLATDRERQLAAATRNLVDRFVAQEFDECMKIGREMDDLFGPSKLTRLYRTMCEARLNGTPDQQDQGLIVLAEK